MACAVRWSTPGCQESRPTHRLQHRLRHHFRLPLPARRHGAVAQERRQRALVAEVLAPGLELLRVLANALAELCQGGPEAVRVEVRHTAASKAALKIARIGDAVLQWRRARPTAWNCCVSPSYQRRLILSLSALCIAMV